MIKVGCCGYPVPMEKYYESFRLVELNTTFYRYPRMSTTLGWRGKAPKGFEFTVKANQEISHKFRFKEEESVRAFEKMKGICKALDARVLLVQTPGSVRPDALKDAEAFFQKADREDLLLAWETRGPAWDCPEARGKLAEALRSLDVSHVTDPFKAMPAYTGKIAYFRLHGLGDRMYYYQYTKGELKKLHEIVKPLEADGEDVYVLFNNLSMFDDGLRFLRYMETGEFPSVTGAVGLESAKRVIESTRYPATKSMLLRKIGWKLVEIEEGEEVRLNELLKEAPSKTYESAWELLKEIHMT